MLAGGRQTRVASRVYWAFVHLTKADMPRRESRGVWGIAEEGQRALAEGPKRIDINFLTARSENSRQFRGATALPPEDAPAGDDSGHVAAQESTPEERIEAAFEEFKAALRPDLQERLQEMDDADFERLIVKLTPRLGQGAGGLGKRTGGARDGAVDGSIAEDVPGLDVICLQAKRYSLESSIGPDKIREFAGAMAAHGIIKGGFLTISRYTRAAREYAGLSHIRLRLIDGNEWARLTAQHGMGVRVYRTPELNRGDAGFFDDLAE